MAEPIVRRFGEDIELYCADCLDILPIPADSVVTDPPYGVSLKERSPIRGKSHKTEVIKLEHSYKDSEDHVRNNILPIVRDLVNYYDVVVLTPGSRLSCEYPHPTDIGCIYITMATGRAKWGFSGAHLIFYYGKDPYLKNNLGARPNSFQRSTVDYPDKNGHPCPKGEKTMEWLVNRGSLPGMTVLDPFMGSGTTGVACIRTGRKFVGIEISKQYFDIACERIERELKQQTLFPARPIMKEQQALI